LSLAVAVKKPVLPRIAMALDASRRGGFKVLLAVLMDLGSQSCGYPVPQNMRDFRASLNTTGRMDAVDKEDVLLGMQCFMHGVRQCQELSYGNKEKSSESGKQKHNINARLRWAAFDLGIAVQNMLQQVGISMADFMLGPQSVSKFPCLPEPSWLRSYCVCMCLQAFQFFHDRGLGPGLGLGLCWCFGGIELHSCRSHQDCQDMS